MPREIPVVYSKLSEKHTPQFEYFNCRPKPHQDKPQRMSVIIGSLQSSGIATIHESGIVDASIYARRVHSQEYLDFLRDTSAAAARNAAKSGDPNEAIYPSVHRYVDHGRATNAISRRGLFIFDTYTPILRDTNEAALGSVGSAIAGADLLLSGEPLAYSLNRPSGHHAEESMGGGMCYLNNAAAAAQHLIDSGAKKVAVLDIDLHHGNGTQDIFYSRSDVLVVNINADPHSRFPHFTGYADEHGSGEGEGANFNFPLPDGTSDAQYADTARQALGIIKGFQPDYLVVSAGFDTHEADPIGAFGLTTPYFQELGGEIRKADLPVLVVQEGGYAADLIGDNVVSLLKGLSGN